LLERVRSARESLSPAERRVANFVLDNPRTALNDPIALIAQGAEVSQPTVIRFCRSLGFQGLADLKLKLGSGLTGTLPVQRSQVRRQDSTSDLCAKVLDNTISAIMHFRESLNVDAVDRAIELLRRAKRVEFYAMGNSAVVALDAQHKLFRFRIPSVAHTDAAMHTMAAELLGPNDVAVFISSSGQPPELARAAGLAVERGAAVIAVTAGQSPLARRSTVCIPVEHNEDVNTFVSMISRILHLLVVDMMSVGLAVRRAGASAPGSPSPTPGQAHAEGQLQPAPGVLISHIA
jgi:glucokinase